jgi:hypothetical protein
MHKTFMKYDFVVCVVELTNLASKNAKVRVLRTFTIELSLAEGHHAYTLPASQEIGQGRHHLCCRMRLSRIAKLFITWTIRRSNRLDNVIRASGRTPR